MRTRRKRSLNTMLTMYPKLLTVLEKPCPNVKEAVKIKKYLDLEKMLGKSTIELEIGCGKGAFICEMAKRNPQKAFVAVEVNQNVIVDACKRAEEMGLKNVRFLNTAAEVLPCFLKKDSVERIYLNFSCPFPKHTYANRRLTHRRFLESYREYLINDGEIHQKTDNMHFFEFSLEQYSLAGYRIKNVSLDLHSTETDNIVTEYEERFAAQGMPIYRVEAY